MNDSVTWQALLTVSGATIFAVAIVRFARQFVDLSRATSRKLAAAVGFIIVEGVTIADTAQSGVTNWYEWTRVVVLAAFVGISAGLAASKAWEIKQDGLDHSTERVE